MAAVILPWCCEMYHGLGGLHGFSLSPLCLTVFSFCWLPRIYHCSVSLERNRALETFKTRLDKVLYNLL